MRLNGQAKMGYFPTPTSLLPAIASWVRTEGNPETLRLLDPCAGRGEALAALGKHLDGETYGIELSPQRAEAAKLVLNHVLNAAFEAAILTDDTFSLALLNPPYDGESMTGGGQRMEYTFLKPTTRVLTNKGVLIYIIPEKRVSEDIARHLAGWYDNLRCFRFPAEEYEAFKQVVIFGRKRGYKTPSKKEVDSILAWSQGKVITGYEEKTIEIVDIDDEGEEGIFGDAPDAPPKKKPRRKKVEVPVYGELPRLEEGSGEYIVPPSPRSGPRGRAFRFKYTPYSDDDYLRAAAQLRPRIEAGAAWQSIIPVIEPPTIAPVMSPKLGHISMLVSGGLMGTNKVTSNGRPMLVKGGTEKYRVKVDDDLYEEEIETDDNKKLFRVRVEERSRPVLYTLDTDGELRHVNDAGIITAILKDHIALIAKNMQERNVPRYNEDPAPWEWDAMAPLSKGGKVLPGRVQQGLTDKQKHYAVALGRSLEALGALIFNAEMAFGKTRTSMAAIERVEAGLRRRGARRSAYPVMVVGPGVVTGRENWPNEIEETVPGAAQRVIETAARPVPKPAKLVDWARAKGIVFPNNYSSFTEGATPDEIFSLLLLYAERNNVSLTRAEVEALRYTLKRARKHPPKKRKGAAEVNFLDARIGGFAWLGTGELPRDPNHQAEMRRRYSLAQFLDEYRSGKLPHKSFAILSYETAKLGSGRVPAMGRKYVRVEAESRDHSGSYIKEVCTCPRCGGIVSTRYNDNGMPDIYSAITPKTAARFVGTKRRYCQRPMPRRVWNPETGEHELRTHDEQGRPYVCGAPLFQDTRLRRESVARYVKVKAPDAFGSLLLDEIHEAKAQSTGNGWAMAVLAGKTRYQLGLTGTLFSGYATSIFWLLYRTVPEVRRKYRFGDAKLWAEDFGLLRETFYVENPEYVDEDGAYTGRRSNVRVDEIPGILPGIMSVALPRIAFASIHDSGLPLPSYNEEIVWLPLTEGMYNQYTLADGNLGDSIVPKSMYWWAIDQELKRNNNKGGIAVWLATALGRLNRMFRSEQVIYNRRVSGRGRYAVRKPEVVMEFAAVPSASPSPKDEWLAEWLASEKRQGRKGLVYFRQTGVHDIQPHVAEYLESRGLRVGILRASVSPRRRMAWITKRAPYIDVLLTNSKLVKVGLNLTMFNSVAFYEPEYSLQVMWQAMRRIYRPGAPLPVKVVFMGYEDTMEERAINLIGKKMKASQLFYGDEVASALTEEDDMDFLRELVRSTLKGETLERATSIFAAENTSTASPLGSPTAESPRQGAPMSLEEWMRRHNIAEPSHRRRRRRKKVVMEGQLGLF